MPLLRTKLNGKAPNKVSQKTCQSKKRLTASGKKQDINIEKIGAPVHLKILFPLCLLPQMFVIFQ